MSEQDILNEACKELELSETKLIHIKGLKWLIENNAIDFYKSMLKLERVIHKKIGRLINLRLQETKDKNKRFDRNHLRGVQKLEL